MNANETHGGVVSNNWTMKKVLKDGRDLLDRVDEDPDPEPLDHLVDPPHPQCNVHVDRQNLLLKQASRSLDLQKWTVDFLIGKNEAILRKDEVQTTVWALAKRTFGKITWPGAFVIVTLLVILDRNGYDIAGFIARIFKGVVPN